MNGINRTRETPMFFAVDHELAELIARGANIEIWRQKKEDAIAVLVALGAGWKLYRSRRRKQEIPNIFSSHGGSAMMANLSASCETQLYCVSRKKPDDRMWRSRNITRSVQCAS